MLAASGRKLTRTKPRGHHTVHAGLLRAARTRGPRQLAPTGQYSAYAVRVPASGVMYVPRTTAPQVGPQAAVHRWPGAMDDSFLPRLDSRLDAAADGGEEGRCAELMSLMEAIEQACAKDRAVDLALALALALTLALTLTLALALTLTPTLP